MLISSSELFFVNYGNEKKEISVTCDCGSVRSYMKCCAVKYTHACQPLLAGFHMVAYMLKPSCPGFVLGSCLSDANPKERSKKILFSALVSINGSALVQEREVVSVSGLQFFAIISPTFMDWC